MFFIYSVILTLAFVVLLPRFAFDALFNGKYAAGFFQRLGFVPKLDSNGREVVWIHCVSVGETNAARPLIAAIRSTYPEKSIVVSTTTKTGQKLANELFSDVADLIFYFPYDWKFSVRRVLRRIRPSTVLLFETEIWFNFLREARKSNVMLAIVNGRLSERSYKRFGYIKNFIRRVLTYPDLALMQTNADAKRIMALGMRGNRVKVTGNIKFDQKANEDRESVEYLKDRFAIFPDVPLIVAASTHSHEEKWILEAFAAVWKSAGHVLPRLLIAPRHPERFQAVADEIAKYDFTWSRRSDHESQRDLGADVILLDSIGELRAAFNLAAIVFVGGSLIRHGGQSVLEPAAAGCAIITGSYTANFHEAVTLFLANEALIQLPEQSNAEIPIALSRTFSELLENTDRRRSLGKAASDVMERNRGATARTMEYLKPMFESEVE